MVVCITYMRAGVIWYVLLCVKIRFALVGENTKKDEVIISAKYQIHTVIWDTRTPNKWRNGSNASIYDMRM